MNKFGRGYDVSAMKECVEIQRHTHTKQRRVAGLWRRKEEEVEERLERKKRMSSIDNV